MCQPPTRLHPPPRPPSHTPCAGTCIYLGVKVTEGPQFARQLSSSEWGWGFDQGRLGSRWHWGQCGSAGWRGSAGGGKRIGGNLHGRVLSASAPARLPAVLSHVLGAPVPTEKVRRGLCLGFVHGARAARAGQHVSTPAASASRLCPCHASITPCLHPTHLHAHPHIISHPTSSQQAIDLEMRCLKNLRWRLGPYCCTRSTPART